MAHAENLRVIFDGVSRPVPLHAGGTSTVRHLKTAAYTGRMCDIDTELRSLDETPRWDFLKQSKHGKTLAMHVGEMTDEQASRYRSLLQGFRERVNERTGYAHMPDSK
jgi:hypothetical protein